MFAGNLSLGFRSVIKQCLSYALLLSLFGCINHHYRINSNDKNHLFIKQLSEQPIIDETTMLPVYLHADEMPQYKEGMMSLLKDFSSLFQHHFKENETIQTSANVVFVIDTTGALTGERIKGKSIDDYTDFERDVLNTIHALQPWTCGRIRGEKVNVLMSFPIHVEPRIDS